MTPRRRSKPCRTQASGRPAHLRYREAWCFCDWLYTLRTPTREGSGNKQNVTRSQKRCCLHLADTSACFSEMLLSLESCCAYQKRKGFYPKRNTREQPTVCVNGQRHAKHRKRTTHNQLHSFLKLGLQGWLSFGGVFFSPGNLFFLPLSLWKWNGGSLRSALLPPELLRNLSMVWGGGGRSRSATFLPGTREEPGPAHGGAGLGMSDPQAI